MSKCTHNWTLSSECPKCLRSQLDLAITALSSVSLSTRDNTAPAHVVLTEIGRRVSAILTVLRAGRVEVHVLNDRPRTLPTAEEAIAYAKTKLYMRPEDEPVAREALRQGRHFSYAYGFKDCTLIPVSGEGVPRG